ncbi:porin [soil metagenome]
MKKIATLAVLAAISVTASAQSSVTLFGVVDAAARYVKNGDVKTKSLASNGANTSRIGFRGIEDLGDGLKAGFWIEGGFNPDDGTASNGPTLSSNGTFSQGRFFNRRTTVSLIGNFGEVRLGRDYTPTYLGYADYDVFGDNGLAASSKFDSSLGTARDTGTRADNQIIYITPGTLGGFYGRAAVAAGEGVAGKRYVGGRGGFASGPFDVSVSYGQTKVAPIAGGDDKFKTFTVGGSYDFAVAKAYAYYLENKFAEAKVASYAIGATVPLGVGLIRAAYTHANSSGTNAAGANIDRNDANEFALGYIYNLSKRTALYTTVAYVKNKGNATFNVAGNPAGSPALVGGEKSTGAEFGIRHAF